MDQSLIDTLKKQMVARRAEIQAARVTNADARETVTLDQASVGRVSRIDALQGQQMALAQERNRTAELVQIEAALQRIEDGSFGYCAICEEEIAEKRLRFNPSVPTCIACAK